MSFVTKIGEKIILPAAKKAFNAARKTKPAAKKVRLFTQTPQKSAHSIILDAKHVASGAGKDEKVLSYFTEVRDLMQVTVEKSNGAAKRFNMQEILQLAPVMHENPEAVRSLLKEVRTNNWKQVIPRFNAATISKLAPVMKKYPETTEKLLRMTQSGFAGKNFRFMGDEIAKLAPVMEKYPETVEKLLNAAIERFGYGKTQFPRFNGTEIADLAPMLKRYPETVKKILNITETNYAGREIIRFNGSEAALLAPVMERCSWAVKELLQSKMTNLIGKEVPRFKGADIANIAPALKERPEIIRKFLNATKTEHGKTVFRYNNKAMNYIASHIQEYSMVEDKKVLSEIDKLIETGKFDDANALIDAMNNIKIKYDTFLGTYFNHYDEAGNTRIGEYEKHTLFARYLKKHGMTLDKLKKGEITKELEADLKRKNLTPEILVKDFQLDAMYRRMGEYIKKNPQSEMSNYLYETYYLKDLEAFGVKQKVIERCREINEKYNVKIMPSVDPQCPLKTIKTVEEELQKWVAASDGKAKLPPIIEFSTANSKWYDTTSAYGKSASAAYSQFGYNGAQAYNRMRPSQVKYAMRHESTHTNDLTRQGHKIPADYNMDEIMPKHKGTRNGKEVQICDPQKGKYYQEFVNAGIPERHIGYAYNNTKEFIAVASEGDMSKYSEEFKQVLQDFGMPWWELKLS